MTDTTTIEIDREQRKELERLKTHERESLKTVMDRLLHDAEPTADVELGDVQAQLDRIESAATTTEDRTGSIQHTLENMGGR